MSSEGKSPKKLLITGGAGFIGSYLIKLLLKSDPSVRIVNLDKLTYCGDPSRLKSVENNSRYSFIQGDVCSSADVKRAMNGVHGIIHLAAETHVDRSLLDGSDFFDTNVKGTYVLLEAARAAGISRFVTVSTDEVYGSRDRGYFTEKDALTPSSPYSISKTAADLLTLSYAHTYGMPCMVTRGSNTFGPFQYPEKVIPLFVSNALSNEPLPLYGDGLQVRNWLHAEDHCRGILAVYEKGKKGEAYNISTSFYLKNIELSRLILKTVKKPESLIRRVEDRAGHDRRYAITSTKLKKLGWKDRHSNEKSMMETVLWYRDNAHWWKAIREKGSDFRSYYAQAYKGRGR